MIGREVSSGAVSETRGEKRDLSVESNRKVDDVPVRTTENKTVEAPDGGTETQKKEKGDGVQRQSRGERRRSKPNPRLSNPPKHLHGEQVAAGWPPWLTVACGEAISGWIPRKADTFEKIDKVGGFLLSLTVVCFVILNCYSRTLAKTVMKINGKIDD